MNLTYITFDGHVQLEKYKYLYFFVMFTSYVLIICSNCSIVCLIVVHRNLHETMYVFIAALLLNSVLLSSAVYPKLLVDFLSEKQVISYPACLFQIFVFYSLSGSEFLLLAAMSYDRYVSICKPLTYPSVMRRSTVVVLLFLSWAVPACHIAVPVASHTRSKLCSFAVKGIFCNNSVNYLFCEASKALLALGVINLFNIALAPMLFVLFTYATIFVTVFRSGKETRRRAAQTCLPHLLVLINYSCLHTCDLIIVRLGSDLSKTARFLMTLQMITYNPLFNPIIYGLKMKDIHKHLMQLLKL